MIDRGCGVVDIGRFDEQLDLMPLACESRPPVILRTESSFGFSPLCPPTIQNFCYISQSRL